MRSVGWRKGAGGGLGGIFLSGKRLEGWRGLWGTGNLTSSIRVQKISNSMCRSWAALEKGVGSFGMGSFLRLLSLTYSSALGGDARQGCDLAGPATEWEMGPEPRNGYENGRRPFFGLITQRKGKAISEK